MRPAQLVNLVFVPTHADRLDLRKHFQFNTRTTIRLDPWQNVNMTLTFADSRTWTAQLFVENLFDAQPIVEVLIQFRQNTRGVCDALPVDC